MYCNTKEMLQDARKNSYAIGAFNISNLEFAQSIIKASIEMNTPVILQASESACKYAGFEELVSMVKCMAEKSPNQIALHLDHGKSFEGCNKAIDAGFTSVMIDLSALSFEENIQGTKKVVEYAKSRNVTVESELGEIVGVEDEVSSDTSHFTDPIKAKEFVDRTGIDSLAVSIGTAHGANKGTTEPKIRFDILEELDKTLPNFPLVCHGASRVDKKLVDKFMQYGGEIKGAQGIPSEAIKKMSTESPICKINCDTDLRLCFSGAIREFLAQNPTVFDPRKILGYASEKITEYVKECMALFRK